MLIRVEWKCPLTFLTSVSTSGVDMRHFVSFEVYQGLFLDACVQIYFHAKMLNAAGQTGCCF